MHLKWWERIVSSISFAFISNMAAYAKGDAHIPESCTSFLLIPNVPSGHTGGMYGASTDPVGTREARMGPQQVLGVWEIMPP